MELILKVVVIVCLILLNGFFVAGEFALVSIRKTRIEELVKKGHATARLVHNALNDLESYISATQLGITFASLALGWVGEPTIAELIYPLFIFLPHQDAVITSHTLAVIIAFILITFLHVVLGELAPKSIALQKAEKTVLLIITPLLIFLKIFRPFIMILNGAGNMVIRVFGFPPPSGDHPVHSEDEIKLILNQSEESGAIEEDELKLVNNVFKLNDINAKQILVPRTQIIAFDITTQMKKVQEQIQKHPYFSRFPVYKRTIDSIVGFIHLKDIYKIEDEDQSIDQSSIIRPILAFPDSTKADDIFRAMRKNRVHLAVINDEYGGTEGIVGMEDIIESLVGDLEDEFDNPLSEVQKQKNGSYLIDGRTNLQELQQRFKIPIKGQGYTTIGGLVFGILGKEPTAGVKVQIGDYVFTVEQIENRRIKTLKLERQKK